MSADPKPSSAEEARAGSLPSGAEVLSIAGPGGGFPFSKGILHQSLLAAAIDPGEAFAAAREIEQQLLASGVREISRSELREISCAVLRGRLGDEVADRYLLWRHHQEPERPVILLLGGTAGVGKSSLSVEVARRLGIGRVLSTDSIREVMRIMTSRELVPALFGSSYDAYRLVPERDGRRQTVIEGFRQQSSAVTVGIRACIERTIAEGENLVLDGVSLDPGTTDVDAYDGRGDVILLLIAVQDEEALRHRFTARAAGRRRRLPSRYLDNLAGILAIQRYLIEQAGRHGVPVIDNVSFELSVRRVIALVTESLRAGLTRAPSALLGGD